MARSVRDQALDTRTARARLKISGKPYYRAIDPGLHLGYRRGKTGGRWVVRWYVGDRDYKVETIGTADDKGDPDGASILSFAQAQAKARELVAARKRGDRPAGPLTVKTACATYIEYLRAEKRTADDAEARLKKHVYPKIGERPIVELTTDELDKWKWALVRHDDEDEDAERRSKDSANRVLTMLKAALNRAFQDDSNLISNDVAWRRVKPFHDVGRSRQVHLDRVQSKRLINASPGAFRRLVTAALLTGARAPHELVYLRVRDLHGDLGTLSIVDGKTGPRDVVLTEEGIGFFEDITAGRAPDALLLPKDDGTAWGKNHHVRPMRDAVTKAKLPKGTTIYSLRHTYASQSLLAGLNLKLLAENMGTSVRMIELHYGKFLAASRRKLIEESAPKLGLRRSKKVARIDRARIQA